MRKAFFVILISFILMKQEEKKNAMKRNNRMKRRDDLLLLNWLSWWSSEVPCNMRVGHKKAKGAQEKQWEKAFWENIRNGGI